MITLLSKEKIQEQRTSSRWILKQSKSELQNWLQDSVVVAFDKESFTKGEILASIKTHPKFSMRFSNWNVIEREGEQIFCVMLKEAEAVTENINRIAFKQFLEENLHNLEYMDKYVAFVNGVLQDSSEVEVELVKKMYEKFGDVDMHIGKVSAEIQSGMIESPEPR